MLLCVFLCFSVWHTSKQLINRDNAIHLTKRMQIHTEKKRQLPINIGLPIDSLFDNYMMSGGWNNTRLDEDNSFTVFSQFRPPHPERGDDFLQANDQISNCESRLAPFTIHCLWRQVRKDAKTTFCSHELDSTASK